MSKNVTKDVWISNQFDSHDDKITILDEKLEKIIGKIYIEKISENEYNLQIHRDDLSEPIHVVYNTKESELNEIIKSIALDLKFC